MWTVLIVNITQTIPTNATSNRIKLATLLVNIRQLDIVFESCVYRTFPIKWSRKCSIEWNTLYTVCTIWFCLQLFTIFFSITVVEYQGRQKGIISSTIQRNHSQVAAATSSKMHNRCWMQRFFFKSNATETSME